MPHRLDLFFTTYPEFTCYQKALSSVGDHEIAVLLYCHGIRGWTNTTALLVGKRYQRISTHLSDQGLRLVRDKILEYVDALAALSNGPPTNSMKILFGSLFLYTVHRTNQPPVQDPPLTIVDLNDLMMRTMLGTATYALLTEKSEIVVRYRDLLYVYMSGSTIVCGTCSTRDDD